MNDSGPIIEKFICANDTDWITIIWANSTYEARMRRVPPNECEFQYRSAEDAVWRDGLPPDVKVRRAQESSQ
jgi:hypothetical protein